MSADLAREVDRYIPVPKENKRPSAFDGEVLRSVQWTIREGGKMLDFTTSPVAQLEDQKSQISNFEMSVCV